jgi:hypothetical protein
MIDYGDIISHKQIANILYFIEIAENYSWGTRSYTVRSHTAEVIPVHLINYVIYLTFITFYPTLSRNEAHVFQESD